MKTLGAPQLFTQALIKPSFRECQRQLFSASRVIDGNIKRFPWQYLTEKMMLSSKIEVLCPKKRRGFKMKRNILLFSLQKMTSNK